MGFRLDPTQIRKMVPKMISLKDIQGKKMSAVIKKRVDDALKSADYDAATTKAIVDYKKINTVKMKQVIDILNKADINDLKNVSGKAAVDQYLKKEIIKKTNLAQIKNERAIEARKESLGKIRSGLIGTGINNKPMPTGNIGKPRLGF